MFPLILHVHVRTRTFMNVQRTFKNDHTFWKTAIIPLDFIIYIHLKKNETKFHSQHRSKPNFIHNTDQNQNWVYIFDTPIKLTLTNLCLVFL
jgi:hypothetical protein